MKQKVTMERRSFVKCAKRAKNPTFLQTCGKSTKNPIKMIWLYMKPVRTIGMKYEHCHFYS